MAAVSTPLPDLLSGDLSLYHATDPLLSDASILVFHGPIATANSHVTSSRIQAHIFSPAGFQSYSRITVSPAAPLYVAVNHLPREKQGDEICRGLAVSLLKYFAELPESVKNALVKTAKTGRSSGRIPTMFDEMHAAELANRMVKVDKNNELIRSLQEAYQEKRVSWVDIDVVLPPGTISVPRKRDSQDDQSMDEEHTHDRYGPWSKVIKGFGEAVFLPTSKLRRAPSQSTNTSKSKTFTSQQKESLRMRMCEFADTEERYVNKIYDLVHNVAEDFLQRARTKGPASSSPNEQTLSQLFPPCLNQILDANMGFLRAIRHILEDTEKDALADLANDTHLVSAMSRKHDVTGSVAFAKALLEWLPRFADPYSKYMRAQSSFSKVLSELMRDNTSSFSRRVQETGEQRVKSMLMEPVQRLPRYSLLIDTMTSSLPSVHPAVRKLLKARDIVTDICSLDSSSSQDTSKILQRLRELSSRLPSSICPQGRVVTAFDFFEVGPPYSFQLGLGLGGVSLVFRDCILLFTKAEGSRMTARGLLAELDKPSLPGVAAESPSFNVAELVYSDTILLQHVGLCHSLDCRTLFVTYKSTHSPARSGLRALVLGGGYEGKAPKLTEELVKAIIEGRFSESERESGKWALLSPGSHLGGVSVLASIFEVSDTPSSPRTSCSNIRLVFNVPKRDRAKIMNTSAVDIIASVSEIKGGQFRLEVDSQFGTGTNDFLSAEGIVGALSRRIAGLLQPINSPRNPLVTESLLHSQFSILKFVASNFFAHVKSSKSFRPPSPTKILSSVLSSTLLKDSDSPSKKSAGLPIMKDIPKFAPPNLPQSKSQPELENSHNSDKITLITDGPCAKSRDPIKDIEATFGAYVLAVHSRSGNIVGRVLRARSVANDLEVNELYNILLEDPTSIQAAAEVSVDVLFAAFEKFLNKAWKDQLGPIISVQALRGLLTALDSRIPEKFEGTFKSQLNEMPPQNRRALTEMIKLLALLLDSSGNDGDRGALTVTFSEFLAEGADPLEFISLLDRLVEDYDRFFDDCLPPSTYPHENSGQGSVGSKTTATGSVGSNTSSFRRRFGFGLSRENSKVETESKVGSIIRTLSKSKVSGETESTSSSFSKATYLLRSKSIDGDSRYSPHSRPGSRDRPGLFSAFGSVDSSSRPNSSHNNPGTLTSIGEKPSEERQFSQRKNRRSSLSDLANLQPSPAVAVSPAQLCLPITPTKATIQRSTITAKRSEIPSPTKTPPTASKVKSPETRPARSTKPSLTSTGASGRTGSPTRHGSPTRTVAAPRKENVSPTRNTLTERAVNRKSDEIVFRTDSPEKRPKSHSSIPGPKTGGLSERAMPVNGSSSVKRTSSSSPQKLQKMRMQSPQKLRERLNNDKKALANAESNLQAELSKIGEELSSLKLSPTTPSASPTRDSSNVSSTANLAHRLTALQSQFTSLTADLNARHTALESDLSTTLAASERKTKKLDELYRDAGRENEALYERFNEELSRAMKNVRGGPDSGVDELKIRLRETGKEAEELRRENWRLKREVVGLKALVQGKDVNEDTSS